jgi:hypothetical protein
MLMLMCGDRERASAPAPTCKTYVTRWRLKVPVSTRDPEHTLPGKRQMKYPAYIVWWRDLNVLAGDSSLE